MFTNRDLRKLIVPLIIEQLFTAMMGLADSMMVSNVGPASLSAVSLVDSVNTLVILLLQAMATGGAVVCAQYVGRCQRDNAGHTARQLLLSVTAASIIFTAVAVIWKKPLLRLIFGSVEEEVMSECITYFLITALSYPFVGVYNAAAAVSRAAGDSKTPMAISGGANVLNIIGNAVLIFAFHMGVAGAALSTLISRILSAAAIVIVQKRPGRAVELGSLLNIRPDFPVMKRIMSIGIPTGVENGLFQFGKLAVQSTISTLGTASIAAQAMVYNLEYTMSLPSMAIGLGLLTVAGQCMGAGKPQEARRYAIKLLILSEISLLISELVVTPLAWPVTRLAGMTAESAELTKNTLLIVTLVKPIPWVLAFTTPYCLRAAGDVKFVTVVSVASMWVFRVALVHILCRYMGFGIMGVWIGMFADWSARGIIYIVRFLKGRWMEIKVLKE